MNQQDFPQKPRVSLISMMAASAMLLLFIIWLGIYQVEEVTRISGSLLPEIGTAPIQFPGSGIIVDLPIHEGQTVRQGETLLRIDPLSGTETRESLQEQIVILEAQRIRVEALSRGRNPVFGSLQQSHPELAANQLKLFGTEMASFRASIAVFESDRNSLGIQRQKLQAELGALARQIKLTQEELDILNSLAKEGMSSRTQIIAQERQLENLASAREALPLAIQEIDERLRGLQSKQDEYRQNLNREYIRELARIDEELRILQARLSSGEKTSRHLELVSPIDGMVSGLKKRRTGEVITPNELIMEIVPENHQFHAVVRIPAQNIGYLRTGLPARITIDAYAQEPDAMLEGILSELSSTSLKDDQNSPYYRGTVSISAEAVAKVQLKLPVVSGMTLNCQIITGKRTLLQYIFNTILRSSNEAFKER